MLAARGDSLPEFDNHCPLLSLPQAFDTHLGNLPADVPYLAAPPAEVARWQERLGQRTRPRIGVVWREEREPPMELQACLPLALTAGNWWSKTSTAPTRSSCRPAISYFIRHQVCIW